MPDDKAEAKQIQQKFYGKPQDLANHLAAISLSKTKIVYEVFVLLDQYSTLDVGCRFIQICNYFQLVKTRNGLFLCRELYRWLTTISIPFNPPISCATNAKTLLFLKSAIDNAPLPEDSTEESPYYTIDEGIVLDKEAIAILDKIGPLFYEKTNTKFNVNSGTRTAYRQAAAMYFKYGKDKTFSEYRNRSAINEILEAIKKAQKDGKNKDGIIQAMTDVIQSQINRKIYISSHLKAGGIDIAVVASAGVPAMSKQNKKIMIEIAKKVTGGDAFEETNPPHIHIQYK